MTRFKIPTTNIIWTRQAIDCYERNCECEGCLIKETLETPCQMKTIIPKIYAKYGKPPENNSIYEENE